MDFSEQEKYRVENMKAIPLDLVSTLFDNHSGYKKGLSYGHPIKIQQKTKDALDYLKKDNNLTSISDTIDLLIACASMSQVTDSESFAKVKKFPKTSGGNTRVCIIEGKQFYSIESAAKMYKVDRLTIMNRIKSTRSRWKYWNYANEDLNLKYSTNRVD